MDIIYPVRDGDDNDELRYSLRSLAANYPHGRVWIVGHKPEWVQGVEFIPGNRFGGRGNANVYDNILLACNNPEISSRVVIFNDDFFVTEPVDGIPAMYRSTLMEHIALPRVQRDTSGWRQSLVTTRGCLQARGIANPVSYELHMPFVADRRKMADILQAFRHVTPANPPQWRSLYGNLCRIGGEIRKDVKCFNADDLFRPFHSTEDRSFQFFRRILHELFPDPCRYEHGGGSIGSSS